MTNAQKWVAAFLGIFLLLFILAKVTKNEDDYFEETENYSNEVQEPAQEVSGLTLINRVGCTNCHGTDLKGTKLAPDLYTAVKYWTTKDALIKYLKNPNSFSRDERFEEYRRQYRTLMPAFDNVSDEDLGKIADYILSLEQE